MTSTALLRRRTRAGAALVIAVGALLALGGLAASGTVTASGSVDHHGLPFSFD